MMTYVHDVTKVIRSVGWYDMVIGVIDSNPKEDSRRVKNNEMRLDENCLSNSVPCLGLAHHHPPQKIKAENQNKQPTTETERRSNQRR
jgi:hypothetical protein